MFKGVLKTAPSIELWLMLAIALFFLVIALNGLPFFYLLAIVLFGVFSWQYKKIQFNTQTFTLSYQTHLFSKAKAVHFNKIKGFYFTYSSSRARSYKTIIMVLKGNQRIKMPDHFLKNFQEIEAYCINAFTLFRDGKCQLLNHRGRLRVLSGAIEFQINSYESKKFNLAIFGGISYVILLSIFFNEKSPTEHIAQVIFFALILGFMVYQMVYYFKCTSVLRKKLQQLKLTYAKKIKPVS